jgi:arsenate reductase
VTADWRYRDPAKLGGEPWERRRELAAMLKELERQLRAFMMLPFRSLDEISLGDRLRELGQGVEAERLAG